MKYPLDSPFFLNRFKNDCTKYIDAGDLVRLERIPPPRSDNQNRYYWALIGIISTATGFTPEEAHDVCRKTAGLTYTKEGKKKHEFLRSTTELTTKEMTDYIDKVRNIGEALGCYMPSADEWQTNWKEIEGQNQ